MNGTMSYYAAPWYSNPWLLLGWVLLVLVAAAIITGECAGRTNTHPPFKDSSLRVDILSKHKIGIEISGEDGAPGKSGCANYFC